MRASVARFTPARLASNVYQTNPFFRPTQTRRTTYVHPPRTPPLPPLLGGLQPANPSEARTLLLPRLRVEATFSGFPSGSATKLDRAAGPCVLCVSASLRETPFSPCLPLNSLPPPASSSARVPSGRSPPPPRPSAAAPSSSPEPRPTAPSPSARPSSPPAFPPSPSPSPASPRSLSSRSEEHTSELQSLRHLVCRLLLEKKKKGPGRPLKRHHAAGGRSHLPSF